jgi:NAD(P)-dependent dehydrogenase (short-subunit alcohol dehydrogenase family)
MFDGKVALVTGAAGGIGAATARMFARNGASVVLGDVSPDVEVVAEDITEGGGRARSLHGDVSDPAYCEALVAAAVDAFGHLDFAFNNAGIGGRPVPVTELSPADWQRVIDVNLNGVFYGIKYQIPAMLQNGGGVIINNSSVLGLKPIPGQSLEYTAAKHGVIGLTRQVAVNHGADGIRCNAICPGFIETPLTAPASDANTGHAGAQWFIDRTPLGRSGKPEEIAGAVKLLCTEDAGYINGASLQVDGGFVLG